MVELQEEVTRAWAVAIMAGARAAQAESMSQESAILLGSTRGEADEASRKVSLLDGELAVARLAWDTDEAKLSSLVDKASDADR
jgi:hypothetical protein